MSAENRTKVLLCIDNEAGYQIFKYLLSRATVEIVTVIVHPERNAIFLEPIKNLCGACGIDMIDIVTARNDFERLIRPLNPDYIVSIYFDYILDDRFIALPRKNSINLHPGYLPYNKGFYYYAWAVLDGTPAGVSIHQIISEVDAGPIISQKRVNINIADTGDIIYQKHSDASMSLFRETWPALEAGKYQLFRQPHSGTRKKIVETNQVMEIDPDKSYKARELIDLMRVFCFPGRGGCVMNRDGKKYSIFIELREIRENENMIMGRMDRYKVS